MGEIPTYLPGVSRLSHSSVSLYLKCPERWRRRYLLSEYEPGSPATIVGSAVHKAELNDNLVQKINSKEDMPEADVLDAYAGEYDLAVEREEVDWGDTKPGTVKDEGTRVLAAYHRLVVPRIQPVAVERELGFRFEGASWEFIGYADCETEDDQVVDIKVKGKPLSQSDADSDYQPAAYLAARRARDETADRFAFHVLNRSKRNDLQAVTVVETTRTEKQIDTYEDLVARVARELVWRAENDEWHGAPPGAWWCSAKYCGYWQTCPYGGDR